MRRPTRAGIGGIEFCALVLFLGSPTFLQAESTPYNPQDNAIRENAEGPFYGMELRTYFYSSDRAQGIYCIENSDGECLKSGINPFLDLEWTSPPLWRMDLSYQGQGNRKGYRTKKALVRLQTELFSWTLGKDSIWIGHGHHGSLLLSNHAEGFFHLSLETKDPVRLPWFLSYLGEFEYVIFHGWLEGFRLLGQRSTWKPTPILEFGASQTVVYTNRFRWWELPKVFLNSEDNVGDSRFVQNDQRASLDVALHLSFLRFWVPSLNGKLYAEYGGEDLRAFWQKEDDWEPPFGFDFLSKGTMGGLVLTNGRLHFRIEYAQNYRGGDHWYIKTPFTRNQIILGHHMGREADDLYLEVEHRWGKFETLLFYDRERHGLFTFPDHPEIRNQYGLTFRMTRNQIVSWSQILFSRIDNLNRSTEPLLFDIQEGSHQNEYMIGMGLTINL